MSTITLTRKYIGRLSNNYSKSVSKTASNADGATSVSEICWMCLAFILFLAMGPFSAIAVVPSLMSLAPSEDMQEPHHV